MVAGETSATERETWRWCTAFDAAVGVFTNGRRKGCGIIENLTRSGLLVKTPTMAARTRVKFNRRFAESIVQTK